MDDLINRQALRDAMYHEAFETDSEMQRWDNGCWIRYKLFENVIDNLPSAEPDLSEYSDKLWKNAYERGKAEALEWIPCSERLPKEEGTYPVVINGAVPSKSLLYEKGFAMGYYYPYDHEWEIEGYEDAVEDLEILAWMPLPEPWKEDE